MRLIVHNDDVRFQCFIPRSSVTDITRILDVTTTGQPEVLVTSPAKGNKTTVLQQYGYIRSSNPS